MNVNEIDDLDVGYEDDIFRPDPNQVDATNSEGELSGYHSDYTQNPADDLTDSYSESPDLLELMLRNRGIDPSSVKFQNADGQIEERDFNDLSIEEQLQILESNDLDDNYGLEDSEVNLINQLRYHNLSVGDYNNYIAQQAVQNYLAQTQAGFRHQVDDIPDDELYLIDIKARIPDISDQDAIDELNSAKANEDIYNKKIQSIRNEYKQKEDLLIQQDTQQRQMLAQQQAQQFEYSIINAIQQNSSIDLGDSALELTNDDKNEIASFILDSDATGARYIAKALNDPNTLVNMVWYALKGKEAFSQINNYYKQKISEVARYNYNKGYEDSRNGKVANSAKSVVKRPAAKRNNEPLTINDID